MREILIGDVKVRLCENTKSKYGYDVWYYADNDWKPCWMHRRAKDDYVVFYLGSSYEAKFKKARKYYLHRLVYAVYEGRPVLSDGKSVIIHHIDGDKGNNKIRNLVSMSRAEHTRYHKLQVAWIRELVEGDLLVADTLHNAFSAILDKCVAIRDKMLNIFQEV